jgi:hypothetical protein
MSNRGIVFTKRKERNIEIYMVEQPAPMTSGTILLNLKDRGKWGKAEFSSKRMTQFFKRHGCFVQVGRRRPFTYIHKDNYKPSHGEGKHFVKGGSPILLP